MLVLVSDFTIAFIGLLVKLPCEIASDKIDR